jgi:hypothetical protein
MPMHWLNMPLGLIEQAVRETASNSPTKQKVNKNKRML